MILDDRGELLEGHLKGCGRLQKIELKLLTGWECWTEGKWLLGRGNEENFMNSRLTMESETGQLRSSCPELWSS